MLKTIQSIIIIFWLVTITSHAKPSETPVIAKTPEWVSAQKVNYQAETIPGSISQGVQYLMVNNQQKYTDEETYYYMNFAKKVVNESGLSDTAIIKISFNPAFQELIFHKVDVIRDGKITNHLDLEKVKILHREKELERQIYDGTLTATILLHDIRIGDIVEYSYSISGQNTVFENRAYDSFNLGWDPIVHKRFFRILLPEERTAALKAHNIKLDPAINLIDGFREYIWDIDNTPGFNPEEDTPDWLSPYPWIEISEADSWREVAIWDIKHFATPKTLSDELEQVINDISKKYKTPKDRYRAILEYTQKEIRYLGIEIGRGSYIPRDPSVTVKNKFGDCKDKTYLFLTMAEKLGLPAFAAMVHSRHGEYLPERLPSLSLFNHVIVHINLNGKNYWLDPTMSPQGGDLDNLYQPDYGHALIINDETTDLIRMNSEKTDYEQKTVEEHFDLRRGYDKPASYTVKTTYRSWEADNIRRQYSNNTPEKILQNYINYYAKAFPDIKSSAPITFEDDLTNNIFTTLESYEIANPWVHNEKDKTLEMHFDSYELDNVISKTNTPIRSMPLKIKFPVKVRQRTTVYFPDIWDIESDNTIIENDAFRYISSETYEDRVLTLDHQYETLAKLIPAENAQQYNKDITRIFRQANYYIYRDDPAITENTSQGILDEDIEEISIIAAAVIVTILAIILLLYYRREFTRRINPDTPYYPVALSKFILMSITTFGVYSLFWFFANWKYVQLRMNSSMWPFARAIFSNITYFFLIKKFNDDVGGNRGVNIYFAAFLGLFYLIFSILGGRIDNGLLSVIFLILSILCLIPLVIRINENTDFGNNQYIKNSRYRISSFTAIILGGSLIIFQLLSGIYYIPYGQTIKGDYLWSEDVTYLKENGLLSEQETLGYLSTLEFFSINDSGDIYTDQKILSYWTDENTGKLNSEKILMKDITNVSLEKGSDIWSKNLRVRLSDDSVYIFEVTNDDNIHKKLLYFVQNHISKKED